MRHVWKEPSYFVAHPLAVAAFCRESTRRRIETAPLFNCRFVTWRGIPLIPLKKIPIEANRSTILLLRTGEHRQGVVGLYQPNLPHQRGRGLAVRYMGINVRAVAYYLMTLYCSTATLTEDAAAVLENVQLDNYYAD